MTHSQQTGHNATKRQVVLMAQSGKLAEAKLLCSTLCTKQPDDAESWFLLAAINGQMGDFPEAEKQSKKAVKLSPENPAAHYNLAFAQYRQGKHAQAEKTYRNALQLNPGFAEAHHDLANLFLDSGRHKQAITHFQRAIKANPNFAQAHYSLGRALEHGGQTVAAMECYRKATQLLPNFADAHFRLGNSLHSAGEYNKAADAFKAVIAINKNHVEAYNNLGNTLKEAGELEAAINSFQKAISLKADFPECIFNLATALQANGLLQEAESTYKKALSNKPIPQAANNLGNLLVTEGRVEEAEEYYRRALASDPSYAEAHSNLLFCLNYKTGTDLDAVYREHRQWEKLHARGAIKESFLNDPSPDRVIVVGYISPDFYQHSVAYFVEALLSSHDRKHFKIICYSDVKKPDGVTERLRAFADHWHNTKNISDDELAEIIKHDRVDILVDLAGHTQGNRLAMLSTRPAPIQLNYIGYPNTTGLSSIDYRITDTLADPVDTQEKFSEKLLRIPDSFLCYTPPNFQEPPEVAPLPAIANEYITFGSFNNLAKLNSETISLWSEVLNSVPNSRLVLKNKVLVDKLIHQHYIELFAQHGINESRLELIAWTHSIREHLLLYNQIDIALDTFPYNGTTTTCEALWMGVPVITLSGNRHASRVGHSLLFNTGLPELVASTAADYRDLAIKTASDVSHLSVLRQGLRERLLVSGLCDRQAYCTNVEGAYRKVWRDWCQHSKRDIQA